MRHHDPNWGDIRDSEIIKAQVPCRITEEWIVIVLKTVLVALDRSDLAQAEMRMLSALCLDAQTKIVLVHVIPTGIPDDRDDLAQPHAVSEQIYRDLEQHLQRHQSSLPCASAIELASGDPAEEIVRLANLYAAELVVIGSRGLQGVDRVIQGSVSSQVLENATCSVLVVKATAIA